MSCWFGLDFHPFILFLLVMQHRILWASCFMLHLQATKDSLVWHCLWFAGCILTQILWFYMYWACNSIPTWCGLDSALAWLFGLDSWTVHLFVRFVTLSCGSTRISWSCISSLGTRNVENWEYQYIWTPVTKTWKNTFFNCTSLDITIFDSWPTDLYEESSFYMETPTNS